MENSSNVDRKAKASKVTTAAEVKHLIFWEQDIEEKPLQFQRLNLAIATNLVVIYKTLTKII